MITLILNKLQTEIESQPQIFNSIKSGEDFENHVLNILNSFTQEHIIQEVSDNGKHSFPDLRIKTNDNKWYGLEVKFSYSGHWNSLGNSVFESVKSKEESTLTYQDIFLIFGRRPKPNEKKYSLEVKFNRYDNVIQKIEVTHSPRFSINMNNAEDPFFIAEGTSYYDFRNTSNSDKVTFIKEYFKKNISENRWYTNDDYSTEMSPALINEMSITERKRIMAETFLIFPHFLFSDSQSKYYEISKYYMNTYFAFSTSLRDLFSSSGRKEIQTNGNLYNKMIYNFYDLRLLIIDLLTTPSDSLIELCIEKWSAIEFFNFNFQISLYENYLNLLKEISENIAIDPTYEKKYHEKPLSLNKIFLM